MKKIFIFIVCLLTLFVCGCTKQTCTVTFDSDGGSAVEKQVVTTGEQAFKPVDPTKENFTFVGWYLENEKYDFTSPVEKDITLKAKWEEVIIYHHVTFKDSDGTILFEEDVEDGKGATAPEVHPKEGYTFKNWDVEFNEVTSDLVVTAQYDVITYTVEFKDYDGKVLKTETVEHGKGATAPKNPTRQGYRFTGWDKTFTEVTSNLTITAQYIQQHTVQFKDYDGKVLKTETVEHGKNATPPTEPSRFGYRFTGWSGTYTNVTQDLEITAQYEEDVQYHQVVFKTEEGDILSSQQVAHGKDAVAPDAPSKDGYRFTGWSDTYTNVTQDLEITAQYEKVNDDVYGKEYTITYNIGEGSWGYNSKEEFVEAFLTDFYSFVHPTESLSDFMHGSGKTSGYEGTWRKYTTNDVYDDAVNRLILGNSNETEDPNYFFNSPTYKEKWSCLAEWVYEMNHRFNNGKDAYGGIKDFDRYIRGNADGYEDTYGEYFTTYPETSEPSLTTYQTSKENIELPRPMNSKQQFSGWYTNSDFTGTPMYYIPAGTSGNLELYAKWSETITYEISFDSQGGSKVDSIIVENGDTVTLPTPTLGDVKFLGWMLNGEIVSSPFTFIYFENIQLVAKWEGTLVDLEYSGKKVTYRNSNVAVEIPTHYLEQSAEFRAAWVTAYIGDFNPSTNKETMMRNLTSVLDTLESFHMNAIIFHLRPSNNAYYKTKLAPIASSFGTYESFEEWDYLTWFIDECHSRGIEFHAWLNPYRIKSTGYGANGTVNDVSKEYQDFPVNPAYSAENILMTVGSNGSKGAILNPAKKDVRDYIVNVCLEIMQNYDVDAIHFDDYFYAQMTSPMAILTEPDQSDYEEFIRLNPSCGYSPTSVANKSQWRRDQIDTFIEQLSNAMTEFNEQNHRAVQLGISPTGIYRNGDGVVTYSSDGTAITTGSNTRGQEHYADYLFCDTKHWIDEEWIDYIIPQSYWGFTHTTAGYADVVDWWAKVVKYKDVNLYTGMGLYMSTDYTSAYSWTSEKYEASNQVLYNTKLEEIKGVSIFSYKTMLKVLNSTTSTQYEGLMRIKNEYWTKDVPTPETKASKKLSK